MNKTTRWLLLATLVSAPSAPATAQDSSAANQERELQRVTPRDEPDRDSQERLFQRAFAPAKWLERLANPDLEARERSFTNLVRRARIDPASRVFLEDLALDGERPHLAWTARLALRELGALPFENLGLGIDGEDYEERFRELFEKVLVERPELQFMTPPADSGGTGPTRADSLRVRVLQSEVDARIEVSEQGQARGRKRVYTGANLAEVFATNPELAAQLKLRFEVLPRGVIDLRLTVPEDALPLTESGAMATDSFGWLEKRPSERGPAEEGPSEENAPDGQIHVRTDILGVYVEKAPADRLAELKVEYGLRVIQLIPRTIADQMGLRSGDVILRLNDRELRRPQDISDAMAQRGEDGVVSVLWLDDGNLRMRMTWTPDPVATTKQDD